MVVSVWRHNKLLVFEVVENVMVLDVGMVEVVHVEVMK